MKLDQWISGACAVALAATVGAVGGCSSTPAPKAAGTTVVSDAVAITQLMSAQLPGPAPKVGKTHLAPATDDDVETESATEDAPKDVRRDDGSRRSGGFGTTK
jgi:hypothetical protein